MHDTRQQTVCEGMASRVCPELEPDKGSMGPQEAIYIAEQVSPLLAERRRRPNPTGQNPVDMLGADSVASLGCTC